MTDPVVFTGPQGNYNASTSEGSIFINPNNPFGSLPEDSGDEYPRVPGKCDERNDIAWSVIIGHELGHSIGYRDEKQNVQYNKNPVRDDLGVPRRMNYRGSPVY